MIDLIEIRSLFCPAGYHLGEHLLRPAPPGCSMIFWLIVTLGRGEDCSSRAPPTSRRRPQPSPTTAAASTPAGSSGSRADPAPGATPTDCAEPVAVPRPCPPSPRPETTQIVDTGATATVGDGTSTTAINTGEHQHQPVARPRNRIAPLTDSVRGALHAHSDFPPRPARLLHLAGRGATLNSDEWTDRNPRRAPRQVRRTQREHAVALCGTAELAGIVAFAVPWWHWHRWPLVVAVTMAPANSGPARSRVGVAVPHQVPLSSAAASGSPRCPAPTIAVFVAVIPLRRPQPACAPRRPTSAPSPLQPPAGPADHRPYWRWSSTAVRWCAVNPPNALWAFASTVLTTAVAPLPVSVAATGGMVRARASPVTGSPTSSPGSGTGVPPHSCWWVPEPWPFCLLLIVNWQSVSAVARGNGFDGYLRAGSWCRSSICRISLSTGPPRTTRRSGPT